MWDNWDMPKFEALEPEIDLQELALLADWVLRHPERQGAPDGIYRVTDEGSGLDISAVYDESAAAHDVLEGAGITPRHLEYQDLREAVANIIRRSRPDILELYRQRLKQLRLTVPAGARATKQNARIKPTVDQEK
jgi:hypothetical protein